MSDTSFVQELTRLTQEGMVRQHENFLRQEKLRAEQELKRFEALKARIRDAAHAGKSAMRIYEDEEHQVEALRQLGLDVTQGVERDEYDSRDDVFYYLVTWPIH